MGTCHSNTAALNNSLNGKQIITPTKISTSSSLPKNSKLKVQQNKLSKLKKEKKQNSNNNIDIINKSKKIKNNNKLNKNVELNLLVEKNTPNLRYFELSSEKFEYHNNNINSQTGEHLANYLQQKNSDNNSGQQSSISPNFSLINSEVGYSETLPVVEINIEFENYKNKNKNDNDDDETFPLQSQHSTRYHQPNQIFVSKKKLNESNEIYDNASLMSLIDNYSLRETYHHHLQQQQQHFKTIETSPFPTLNPKNFYNSSSKDKTECITPEEGCSRSRRTRILTTMSGRQPTLTSTTTKTTNQENNDKIITQPPPPIISSIPNSSTASSTSSASVSSASLYPSSSLSIPKFNTKIPGSVNTKQNETSTIPQTANKQQFNRFGFVFNRTGNNNNSPSSNNIVTPTPTRLPLSATNSKTLINDSKNTNQTTTTTNSTKSASKIATTTTTTTATTGCQRTFSGSGLKQRAQSPFRSFIKTTTPLSTDNSSNTASSLSVASSISATNPLNPSSTTDSFPLTLSKNNSSLSSSNSINNNPNSETNKKTTTTKIRPQQQIGLLSNKKVQAFKKSNTTLQQPQSQQHTSSAVSSISSASSSTSSISNISKDIKDKLNITNIDIVASSQKDIQLDTKENSSKLPNKQIETKIGSINSDLKKGRRHFTPYANNDVLTTKHQQPVTTSSTHIPSGITRNPTTKEFSTKNNNNQVQSDSNHSTTYLSTKLPVGSSLSTIINNGTKNQRNANNNNKTILNIDENGDKVLDINSKLIIDVNNNNSKGGEGVTISSQNSIKKDVNSDQKLKTKSSLDRQSSINSIGSNNSVKSSSRPGHIRDCIDELNQLTSTTQSEAPNDVNQMNSSLSSSSTSLQQQQQQQPMFRPPSNMPPLSDGEVIQLDIDTYRMLLHDLQSTKTLLHKLVTLLREPSTVNHQCSCLHNNYKYNNYNSNSMTNSITSSTVLDNKLFDSNSSSNDLIESPEYMTMMDDNPLLTSLHNYVSICRYFVLFSFQNSGSI
jgi:hypothetical protein